MELFCRFLCFLLGKIGKKNSTKRKEKELKIYNAKILLQNISIHIVECLNTSLSPLKRVFRGDAGVFQFFTAAVAGLGPVDSPRKLGSFENMG
jgi:hypothetical protein